MNTPAEIQARKAYRERWDTHNVCAKEIGLVKGGRDNGRPVLSVFELVGVARDIGRSVVVIEYEKGKLMETDASSLRFTTSDDFHGRTQEGYDLTNPNGPRRNWEHNHNPATANAPQ